MTSPRLEISLDKIFHNASTLVSRLKPHGISVTGITKACMGDPRFAETLLEAGVRTLGDSRIENIERLRRAGVTAPISLIRSPMLSQAEQVVAHADTSFNTELDVISALSDAAGKANCRHNVLLMVELGDLREGIMPHDLEVFVRRTLRFPHIDMRGIGTNLACLSGIAPTNENMLALSQVAEHLDKTFCEFGTAMTTVVSGGNSSNLSWVFGGCVPCRVNNLRLGESILLGVDPLHNRPIDGLHTDAVTLFVEVIEQKVKPSHPRGEIGLSTFKQFQAAPRENTTNQAILAIGQQDIDPTGLTAPSTIDILGASSDHLIIRQSERAAEVGSEISFQVNYSAMLRAMTSPFVSKDFVKRTHGGAAAPQIRQ